MNNFRTGIDKQEMSTDHFNKNGTAESNGDVTFGQPRPQAAETNSGQNMDYHKTLKKNSQINGYCIYTKKSIVDWRVKW